VGLRSFAAVDAVFDHLLGVVPGAAGIRHEHGQELAHQDHPRQEAAQRVRPEEKADEHRRQDGEHSRADQLVLGAGRADVHHLAVVGLLGAGEDRRVLELLADLVDDVERRPAHRPNQHRAEQERHGPAHEEADQHQRVGHRQLAGVEAVLLLGHLAEAVLAAHRDHRDEAGKQRNGRDHRRADGDPLGLGLGGVAHRVQVGQDLPGPLVLRGGHVAGGAGLELAPVHVLVIPHLANAVGVVGHRAEHVHGDRVAGEGEHADAGHGHAEGDEHRRRSPITDHRKEDRTGNHQDRRDRALVTHGKPLNDVRRMAGLAAPGQRLHRGVRGVGVIAGDLVQRDGQEDADQAGQRGPHVEAADAEIGPRGKQGGVAAGEAGLGHLVRVEVFLVEIEVPQPDHKEPRDGDHRADPEAAMDALQGGVGGVFRAGLHGVGADDRAQHADAADQQGEDHALVAEAGQAEDHGGDDGHLVALEDVGGHPGAVAHVVAHVVGDRGGIAGIVLGNAGLDFPDQVGAHVGGLGVNAAAHAHEQRQQRAAEAEAQEGLVGLLAVDEEDAGAAEQAEAVGEHAGDRARAVAQLHGLAVAPLGGGGDAEVAGRGQPHAHEAHGPAEQRAQQECPRPAPGKLRLVHLGEVEEDRNQNDQRADLAELGPQVRIRPFPHGPGDLLHLRRALLGFRHLAHEHVGVGQPGNRNSQHEEQRQSLADRKREDRGKPLETVAGRAVGLAGFARNGRRSRRAGRETARGGLELKPQETCQESRRGQGQQGGRAPPASPPQPPTT